MTPEKNTSKVREILSDMEMVSREPALNTPLTELGIESLSIIKKLSPDANNWRDEIAAGNTTLEFWEWIKEQKKEITHPNPPPSPDVEVTQQRLSPMQFAKLQAGVQALHSPDCEMIRNPSKYLPPFEGPVVGFGKPKPSSGTSLPEMPVKTSTAPPEPEDNPLENESALQRQCGGSHYKNLPIQPVEFCHKNNLSYIESAIVKYVVRWKSKDGKEDLLKAKHYIDLLIELEFPNE